MMQSKTRTIKNIYQLIILFFLKIIYQTLGFGFICNLLSYSSRMNRIIIRGFGGIIGNGTTINSPLLICNANGNFRNIIIGNDCHIGKDVLFDLKENIQIKDFATISMRTIILTHMGVGESPLKEIGFQMKSAKVIIESGAYTGAGVIILPGVTIGECAVIGAGAVVTKDIPAYTVAFGVPAKVVRKLDKK